VVRRSGAGWPRRPRPDQDFAAVHYRAKQERERRALRRPAHRGRRTGSQGAGDRLLAPARRGRSPEELSDREEKDLRFTIKPDSR